MNTKLRVRYFTVQTPYIMYFNCFSAVSFFSQTSLHGVLGDASLERVLTPRTWRHVTLSFGEKTRGSNFEMTVKTHSTLRNKMYPSSPLKFICQTANINGVIFRSDPDLTNAGRSRLPSLYSDVQQE